MKRPGSKSDLLAHVDLVGTGPLVQACRAAVIPSRDLKAIARHFGRTWSVTLALCAWRRWTGGRLSSFAEPAGWDFPPRWRVSAKAPSLSSREEAMTTFLSPLNNSVIERKSW